MESLDFIQERGGLQRI